MSDSQNPQYERSPDSTIDTEMAMILEQYLQDQENGTALPREEWLAKHPDHAERLAACLDGVELMGAGGFLVGEVKSTKSESARTVPQAIGDYEIIRELGRGGMGVVYEAREKSLDRIVALKVLRFGVVDPKALERFQREAETAGDLHHTNIVPVYATGREGDTSWYAMQRIEGESLAHRIDEANQTQSKGIRLDEILRVGIQAAEALDHAHQRDVIHRDVKPANLIVDQEDRVWLTDFGLARRLVDVGATMTGAMLGTPRYMSPEQANLSSGEVDHRTDIYSLGATLYELACGQPPFDGTDPLKVITQIRYEEAVSIRANRPDLPRDLDVVLSKCLEKDPSRRYASAADLAADLRAIGEDRAISAKAISLFERASRATRKHAARVRLAGLATLATAITILGSLIAWQGWDEGQYGAFRFRAGGGPFASTVRPVGEDSFSDDAQSVTVPMQVPLELKAGDYDMMLAPRGAWSRNVRLPIARGDQAEYRMGGHVAAKSVDIGDANAVAVAGFNEPAVLMRRDGRLQRITASGQNNWSLDVSEVKADVIPLTDTDAATKTQSIDYAKTDLLIDSPQNRALLESSPQFAAAATALTTPIDLDGDAIADTIVAATEKSALLAIDASGKILWARAYDLNGDLGKGNPSNPPAKTVNKDGSVTKRKLPQLSYPGVMQMIDVGDTNEDGVNDLAVSMIHIQPGIKTDVAITLVSGKTGDVISSIAQQPLAVGDGALWPIDGMLRLNGNLWRDSGTLSFNRYGARRNRINWDVSTIRWGKGYQRWPTFAVPSPVQVVRVGDKRLAIYHTDDKCWVFDLIKGDQVGQMIKLPFASSLAPRVARLGDDQFALVFHEPKPSTKMTALSRGESTTFVAYRLADGQMLWSHEFLFIDWSDSSHDRSRCDWPLVSDIDDDGDDELLLPKARTQYLNQRIGVQMVDARTGKQVWDAKGRNQFEETVDTFVRRMVVSSDIDSDGWREWVTATIAGDAEPKAITRSLPIGNAYVYLEWLSGKSGEVLAWARSPIPILSNRIDVAEIDAIRCDVPAGHSIFASDDVGAVEIDLITGDSRDDLELDSMVLRFHPSSPDPIAIAAGVEGVALPFVSASKQRLFYARPGPYADGPERLVFLDDRPSDAIRLGENEPLAAWSESERDCLALKRESPRSLAVVDTQSHKTLWRWQQERFPYAEFHPVKFGDGSVDILGCIDPSNESPPELWDGKNGRLRWTLSDSVFGSIKTAAMLDDDQRMLIVGDGTVSNSGFPRPPPDFKMTMANASNGQVLWSKYFLRSAPRLNHPQQFDYMRFADVNGDGVTDIIGPDQGDENELQLAAWDGATGDQLWARLLGFPGKQTDYFVPFSIINRNGKTVVAYIGPTPKAGAQNVQDAGRLIIGDAQTGATLMSIDFGHRFFLSSLDRYNCHRRFAMADCSVSAEQSRIGVLVQRNQDSFWGLYDIGGEEAVLSNEWVQERKNGFIITNRWLRDIDGDSIPERLTVTRRPKDTPASSYDYEFNCYPLESNKPTWTTTFTDSRSFRHLHWLPDPGQSLAYIEREGSYTLINLATGVVLREIDIPPANKPKRPVLTGVHRDASGMSWRLAEQSKEGIVSRWVGNVSQAPITMALHQRKDPRRVKNLFGWVGLGHTTPWQMIRSSLLSSLALLAIVIVPVWYLYRMIRDRRWSLSWLMLAPPVVMLFLIVWSSEWIQTPGRFWHVLGGASALMVPGMFYIAFKHGKSVGRFRDDRLHVISSIVLIFVAFLLVGYVQASDPEYHYVFEWSDLFKLLWYSVCTTAQIFCLLSAVRWVGSWRSRRSQEQAQVGQVA